MNIYKLLWKTFRTVVVYTGSVPYVNTFSAVAQQQVLGYLNSMLNFSLAINMGNFAAQYKISSGPQWTIELNR
jgi:S-adenosylmethionine hydrolase